MENAHTNKLGTAPIGRLLTGMSLPMMASMLISALYNIVDSMFVAKFSQDSLTALSLAFPFQMVLIGVSVGTGIGASSLMARRLGEKRIEEADNVAMHGVFLAILGGIVFLLAAIFLTRPALGLFKASGPVYSDGVTYLTICLAFGIFPSLEIMCEKILQGTGHSLQSMIVQILGAVINIVLDPIMIFGYFGCPALGVAGAAWATIIGQGVSMVVGIIFVLRSPVIKLRLRLFKPRKAIFRDIYGVGLPSIIMQCISSVTTFGMNKVLIGFSETAVTVLGLYFKLQSFVFMPVFGLNSGAMPIMAYNYGARNKGRIVKTLKLGCILALLIMTVGMILFQTIPSALLSIFDPSPDLVSLGTKAFRTISLCFPFAALSIMCGTTFQSVGKGIYSLIVTVSRQLLIILPAANILAAVTHNVYAVWYAYPIAELISCAVCMLLLSATFKKYLNKLDEPLPPAEQ